VNIGGVLLMIVGFWINTQVWGGKALERLKIIDEEK
jgi:hypothetical protein